MQMDTKKKTLLVITIIAFGYLGYQIYGWIKGDADDLPQITEPSHEVAVQPSIVNAEKLDSKEKTMHVTPLEEAPLEAGQKAYLNMVNQYELAKMERRLLEERVAIAAAQLQIATLNKKTKAVDGHLVKSIENNDLVDNQNSDQLQLNCVNRLNGRWSATLKRGGHYYQVHIGSTLGANLKVTDINHRGVTLKRGSRREYLTFNGIEMIAKEHDTVVATANFDKERL